jgi:hypothetical protein
MFIFICVEMNTVYSFTPYSIFRNKFLVCVLSNFPVPYSINIKIHSQRNKLRVFGPRANYTERTTAACR